MSNTAKTPVRPRHARAAPTPSTLALGFSSLSLSPKKSGYNPQVDSSNPFIERKPSRPFGDKKNSPVKRGPLDHMAKDAVKGIITKGGIETKFDVIKRDYFVGENQKLPSPKKGTKRLATHRSKSSTSSAGVRTNHIRTWPFFADVLNFRTIA